MKRITGGHLSREATATLLSSHAGGPRAATGDKPFVSQTKRADTVVNSQPVACPKDLPVGSDVTAQTADDDGSDSRPRERPPVRAPVRLRVSAAVLWARR